MRRATIAGWVIFTLLTLALVAVTGLLIWGGEMKELRELKNQITQIVCLWLVLAGVAYGGNSYLVSYTCDGLIQSTQWDTVKPFFQIKEFIEDRAEHGKCADVELINFQWLSVSEKMSYHDFWDKHFPHNDIWRNVSFLDSGYANDSDYYYVIWADNCNALKEYVENELLQSHEKLDYALVLTITNQGGESKMWRARYIEDIPCHDVAVDCPKGENKMKKCWFIKYEDKK